MSAQKPVRTARRSFWFDPRFAIGIALVAASVIGVYAIVAGADRTTTVYAAGSTLTAGDTVQAADLVATKVRLGSAGRLYLASIPPEGVVVNRSIAEGELVPASAVGDTAGLEHTRVVISVRGQLAGSVATGSVVDVWSAKEVENGRYAPPSVLVESATVVRILTSDSLVAGRNQASVEILVPREKVAAVLQAQADSDTVSVVPDSMPLER